MTYIQNNPFSRRSSSPLNEDPWYLERGVLDEKTGEPTQWGNPASLKKYAHNRAISLGFEYGSPEYSDVQSEAKRLAIRKRAMNSGQNLRDWNIAQGYYPSRGRNNMNPDWTANSDEERARRKYFGDFGTAYE